MTLLRSVKRLLVSETVKPRRILAGPFKGIRMNLSLRNQMQIYCGLFERELHPSIRHLSRGIATAIDIGAAYGEYTIFFLTKTPARKIFAFEPGLQYLSILKDHLEMNQADLSRVALSTKLVGASDSEQAISLDSLAQVVQTPCLVKMDVDGAEEQILQGATLFNLRPDIRWIIETHSKELEVRCVEMLKAAHFETKIIPNAWWRTFLPEMRPTEHNRWLVAWKTAGEPGRSWA